MLQKTWSGRRDSNPRPRPWQGRALPLSYTRIRAFGSDYSPATGRAMPNAALECNSPRVAQKRPDDRLWVIMAKVLPETVPERPPTLLYLTFGRETLPAGVFRGFAKKTVWRGRRWRQIAVCLEFRRHSADRSSRLPRRTACARTGLPLHIISSERTRS